MATKASTELSEDDRITYDYGQGVLPFTVVSVYVHPEGSIDQVSANVTESGGGMRILGLQYTDSFEVPGW